jgi:hypothetical protein
MSTNGKSVDDAVSKDSVEFCIMTRFAHSIYKLYLKMYMILWKLIMSYTDGKETHFILRAKHHTVSAY